MVVESIIRMGGGGQTPCERLVRVDSWDRRPRHRGSSSTGALFQLLNEEVLERAGECERAAGRSGCKEGHVEVWRERNTFMISLCRRWGAHCRTAAAHGNSSEVHCAVPEGLCN